VSGLEIISIAMVTALATMLGGLLALSWTSRLNLVLGFSAGAVIGVAFFDLLPEALTLSGPMAMAAAGGGFFLYLLFDRLLAHHGDPQSDIRRGILGAGSFSAHSLLDGLGIGLAFQAGAGVGLVVSAAVLAHDFADGLNTVNVITRNGGERRHALRWLVVDALAPVAGATLSLFVSLPSTILGLLLAGFAGFFLYIGGVDLLPESQRQEGRVGAAAATLAGALFLYAVARLAM
jgi:ZIP family zinc transporter